MRKRLPKIPMPQSCDTRIQRDLIRIPRRFEGALPNGILNSGLKQVVYTYLDKWKDVGAKGWGLALGGPSGLGKSWCMASILHFLVAARYTRSALFVLAEEFFRFANPMAVLDLNGDAYTGDETWREYYMRVPVLGICDLGKEDRRGKFGENAPFIFGSVLRARVQKGLVTMLDTNLTFRPDSENSMAACYGMNVWDLMHECMLFVQVKGTSLRKQQQESIKRRLQS